LYAFLELLASTLSWLSISVATLSALLKSRASLQLENVALRHQIGVLQRSAKKRLRSNKSDLSFANNRSEQSCYAAIRSYR
jgi:hypothetical protein